jgi:hypothetical protein
MKKRTASNVNYQAVAAEFQVGDLVVPFGHSRDSAARVVAVWPAIGMVDVQYNYGPARYPVEDLQRFNEFGVPVPTRTDTVPGGAGTVSVPGGPDTQKLASRVALAHEKKAVYWGALNRTYKATQEEQDSGDYKCPRCRDVSLRLTSYKREDGKNIKLLACHECLFLIRPNDLVGCHHFIPPNEV